MADDALYRSNQALNHPFNLVIWSNPIKVKFDRRGCHLILTARMVSRWASVKFHAHPSREEARVHLFCYARGLIEREGGQVGVERARTTGSLSGSGSGSGSRWVEDGSKREGVIWCWWSEMIEGRRRGSCRDKWLMAWKRSRSLFVLLLILISLASFFPALAPLPTLSSSSSTSSRLHDDLEVCWFLPFSSHLILKQHFVIYLNPKNSPNLGNLRWRFTFQISDFPAFFFCHKSMNDREFQDCV